MSDRLADFLIHLAEDDGARAAFESAPEAQMAAHGLTAEEAAAMLSGDDARIFALCAPATPAKAPVVAKIWTGLGDEPGETPAVAKIWTGLEDEPGETPAVAKIWTGLEDEPGETPAVAKIWTGLDEEDQPQQLAKRA